MGLVALEEWDADTAAKSGLPLVYDLGGWLEIECSTSGRTSQSSASSLVSGFGSDQARPRNVGMGWGLSVESARMNKVRYSDTWTTAPAWTPGGNGGMTPLPGQPDPAGSTFATQFSSPGLMGGNQSNYHSAVAGYASAWLKGNGLGSGPFVYFVSGTAGGGWTYVSVDEKTWKRYGFVGASGYIRLEAGADPDGMPAEIAGITAVVTYGAQIETDASNQVVKYPSSYIPTKDIQKVREADILTVKTPGEVAPGGYFHVKIRFAPNYASGEHLKNEHDLLYINNNYRLYLKTQDNTIILRLDGQTIISPALTWQRDQEFVVEAIHSPTERRLIVSAPTTLDLSGTPVSPAPNNIPYKILGNTTGAQECADLRYIGFFQPN
jgi:hypothetical protein